DQLIFDKTGTLTLGNMSIADVVPLADVTAERLLQLAAGLERGSLHPIARAFSDISDRALVREVKQQVGAGISGINENTQYVIGQPSYITELFGLVTPELPSVEPGQLPLLLADKNRPLGWILLQDELRPGAAQAISRLKAQGIEVSLLSGDRQATVDEMAEKLGVTQRCGDMSPEQKLAQANRLQKAGHRVIMVGDGINDVPVLSGADASVALGDATDFARIHADSILLSSNLDTLPKAIDLARKTRRVIQQNLSWALCYNLLALPLAAAGMIPPWAAAIGMSVSSLLVVLNALRLNHMGG
ncbi:MAG: HAD-IC family P-type ATPase, partial [Porticoccus sp.]